MLERLKELCALDGVSGFEENVREYIKKRVEPFADELREDVMGNLMVFKRGKTSPSRRLLMEAHMDEVGFIVKNVTDEGYLKFGCVGGIDRRVLPGKRVTVGEKRVPGVIGIKAVHLTTPDERKSVPKISDMYIDIGAKGREAALELVELGDCAAFDSAPVEFGDGFLKAKAIDDRVGCALLMSLIEEELPCDCWFVFTVQEEVGLRGAGRAAFRIGPDAALIVEGTTAADLPGIEEHRQVCFPGRGAVLPFMDGSAIYDRGLFEALRGLAEKNAIPAQVKKYVSGGTDAGAVQRTRGGVRVAAVSAAVRYIHSPSSVASIRDFDAMYRLIKEFLRYWGEQNA